MPATQDDGRDILDTALAVDVTTRQATATIHLAPSSTSTGASFEVGDLAISGVTGPGGPLEYRVVGKRLDVGVAASAAPVELTVKYQLKAHTSYDGVIQNGLTFTWPYFCGNVFPCHSAPADGLKLALSLTGVPAGQTAVFPAQVSSDAPSYMLAWAVGDFTFLDLGATPAGTSVGVYYRGTNAGPATSGTQHLKDIFGWYEANLGAYPFGDRVASVQANWGPGAYGGMEHHPFWHVASSAMADEETHAHEAAHGWYGDGVRLRCWEDFVFSEGTASYLTARAMGAVIGAATETQVWAGYQAQLDAAMNDPSVSKVAWPRTCNQVDVLTTLYTSIPYMKGAFFYRAVEAKVGAAPLLSCLGRFYAEHRNGVAGMQDMLDAIRADTGYDATACARAWLETSAVPTTACQ